MESDTKEIDRKYYFPDKIYRAILSLYDLHLPSGMTYTHFTFPRRVGKTTAIANFFAFNDNAIVITPNMQMRAYLIDVIKQYYNDLPEERLDDILTVDQFKNWTLGKDLSDVFWIYEGTNTSLEKDRDVILNLTKFRGSRNGVFIT